jgi:malonyl-CoA O-methyltransferase
MQTPEQLDFNALAGDYHDHAVVARHASDMLVERLLCWKQMPECVLDLGAGTGFVTESLLALSDQVEVYALDVADRMLDQVPASARVTRVLANARSMPCRDQQFDAVLANMVLPWCAHWPDVFAQVKRVLRPGGMFLFTTLSPYSWQKNDHLAWGELGCWRDLPDMDVVGDVLLRQGFIDTVMDRLETTFVFDDLAHMADDLMQSGFLQARPLIDDASVDPSMTMELVFGHAIRGEQAGNPSEFIVDASKVGRVKRG